MKSLLLLIIPLLVGFRSQSQSLINLPIAFQLVLGNFSLLLNDTSNLPQTNENLNIETLKFYISKVQLYQIDSLAFEEQLSFHLIDISNPSSLKFSIKIPKNLSYNRIQFYMGIDSITNVSGVMGGDLDPIKGMYWTWQSGYINFKLEGKSKLCKTKNNLFQFHLGGYQIPNSCLQTINLEALEEHPIFIKMDIEKFIKSIDLVKLNHIMSPSAEAVKLSEYLVTCFSK